MSKLKNFVTNLQKTVYVDVKLLEANIARIQKAMKIEKFRVNVWLRSDKKVQEMNKWDRKEDRATDVLSYSNLSIPPGTIPEYSKSTQELGNLFFGMGYIMNYCQKRKISMDDHLERLAVHGMCHLLGYDHEVKEDYRKMKNRENYIMRKLKQMKKEEAEAKLANGQNLLMSTSKSTNDPTDIQDSITVLSEMTIKEQNDSKNKINKRLKSNSKSIAKTNNNRRKKRSESESSSSSASSSSSSSLDSSSS